ncbi:hypothetical protein TWF696_009176 [Orbilia brochopaga]|uniref:Uncharacterized protein n=1 Tax=Orbilia brochopaga TaxID=3140254 RepID=A0AAV9UEI0_9PEZI
MHYNCVETQRPITWTLPALLVVAALAIEGCDARPWGDGNAIPTATEKPDVSKPNSIVYLQPTPFNFVQAFVERRLRKRVDYPGSVCGFVGGDVATPAVCSSNSICLWDTVHGAVGCSATDDGSLAFYTTCVDKNNNNVDSLKGNLWAFTCKGNDECYRNSYEPVNGQGFTQWGCGSSDWATTILTQPSGVVGQSAKVALTSIDMPSAQDASSSDSSSATSTSDADSSTSPSSSASSTNSGSSTQSSSSSGSSSSISATSTDSTSESSSSTTTTESTTSKTEMPGTTIPPSPRPTSNAPPPQMTITAGPDVGSIAGGVIGGVAGLAVIAALLFAFRKRRDDDTVQMISEASRTSPGPRDMGEIYEPKELDATPQIRSELHGDSAVRRGRSPSVAELPGSPVPQPVPRPPPPPPPPPVAVARGYPGYPGWSMHDREVHSPSHSHTSHTSPRRI